MKNKVVIGEVVAPSGFKGQFKIKSFTEKKDDFFKYGPFTIGNKFIDIKFTKIRSSKDMFIVCCDEVKTEAEADGLRDEVILIERNKLPIIREKEKFYHHDLINLEVFDEINNFLGTVIAIDNYGSDDIIEIKMKNLDENILISINEKFINKIDLSQKKIFVKNIDGYKNEKNI
jgi:16S rRNA processing protein RimM|tara:strand:+ start:84 stop:605 length:522 start_codon:yes stop_codon:yes gene_type:complete